MSESEQTAFVLGGPWPWHDMTHLVAQPGFGWHPDSGNMLLVVEEGITEQMVADFHGPADVALIAHGPLVGLMVRFGGGWDWQETLAWRNPGDGVPEPLRWDAEESGHLLFRAVLVDSGSGTIMGMRAFTASAHLTKMLIREVADRWREGVDTDAGLAARAEWNERHPTINSALKAALARSHGGD